MLDGGEDLNAVGVDTTALTWPLNALVGQIAADEDRGMAARLLLLRGKILQAVGNRPLDGDLAKEMLDIIDEINREVTARD